MAEQRPNKQSPDTESIISRCGSISGETFVSLRSRRNCPPGKAPHKIDQLAKSLKDYHSQLGAGLPADSSSCYGADCGTNSGGQRLNDCFHHYRFIIAMLAGMAVGIMLFQRYGMTIAILRMVNQTHLYLEEHPNKTVQDFLDEGYTPTGEFLWNNEIVAIILGWYMFSYTLPQTLAAKWTNVLGCRFALPLWLIICTISNMITPTAAYMGWRWVVACRLLNGLGAAGVLPGMLKLLEDWMRYDELSAGLSTAQLLIACIGAICPLASGYLTAIHWSLSFYVPCYVTVAFCAVWLVLVSNKPQSSWLVSQRELRHLCECDMAETVPTKSSADNQTEKQPKALENGTSSNFDYKPDSWVRILELRQFYAYLLIWIINCSSYTAFTFVLPAYMRQFLKIPISENGFYCFIIQIGCILAVIWPHQVLRVLIRRGMSITKARILLQGICSLMMILTWLYVGCLHQYQLPLLFLNRCFVASDLIVTGSVMSNFAKAGISSVAFAMINTVGNLSITGTSTLIGWLLDYTGSSRFGWQVVFCGLAAAQVVMFLTFAIFIDSDPIKFKQRPREKKAGQSALATVLAIEDYRRGSFASAKQRMQNLDQLSCRSLSIVEMRVPAGK